MMALAMSQDIILRHVLFMHATLFSRSRGLADQGYVRTVHHDSVDGQLLSSYLQSTY